MKLPLLAGTLFLLVGCGGSGGGDDADASSSNSENAFLDPVELPSNMAQTNDANSAESLPNWIVTDLAITRVSLSDGFSPLSFVATVKNIGDVSSRLPCCAYFMESSSEDFSNGHIHTHTNIDPIDEDLNQDHLFLPGESVDIERGFSTSALTLSESFTWTNSFVKLWLNPDRGTIRFLNEDEGIYESEYSLDESNYLDNMSETLTIERDVFYERACFEEDLEENDNLDVAQQIDIDTTYTFNHCLDDRDVFSIVLNSNTLYQLDITGSTDKMRMALISPENEYIFVQSTSVFIQGTTPFRTTSSGTYRLITGSDHFISGAQEATLTISEI